MSFQKYFSRNVLPATSDELMASSLFNSWWYYSVELLPGQVTKGQYPNDFPMLPRMLLRNCELDGTSCLDIGSMEGLIPTLMCRKGAKRVIATDAIDHCAEKMAAVKHYYDVNFDFKKVGLLYNLYEKFPGQGFDLINLSGVLYHVFSPLLVLSGVRPLLKKNGLMIVSTNVICSEDFIMEFNNAGRLQVESNTFWYLSIGVLDYMLRYLKLAPIDCLYLPHTEVKSSVKYVFDKPSGFLSVVCRAESDVLPTSDDKWMAESARDSWEYKDLPRWDLYDRQTTSGITYNVNVEKELYRSDAECIDLWKAVNHGKQVASANRSMDAHVLQLTDNS